MSRSQDIKDSALLRAPSLSPSLSRDTLNTPFFDGYKTTAQGGAGVYQARSGTRNEGDPDADIPGYAPIPPDGADFGFTTYKRPLDAAEAYYSLMYIGKIMKKNLAHTLNR